MNLRHCNWNDGTCLLQVLLDEYLCGIFLKEPIFIPFSIFTENLILYRSLVGLLVETVDFRLALLYLIIELLNLTGETILLICQIGDLLLNLLALEATNSLQFLF